MSRLTRSLIPILLGAAIGLALVSGCASTTAASSPQQTAINAAYTSYASLDQAIVAADAAVKAGTLKGQDARNALAGFTIAKTGLDAGLVALRASAAASAASGAAK